ncbi:LLM class F420-dependent oxidoreductase [Rugosimonospora africana]|uniref:LLM class F420-dependent oxidoreductase n=1 Tax=Rugosimonospora africana TaxID=556532 RepID=A0A8J3QPE8_9ACTN|nr:LLM class F420-dependent oxidoreductase [Rugosimonospora africana]GIH14594.1 LLM class F420-dependent oxidoreductase [Rugosimonospora africana]
MALDVGPVGIWSPSFLWAGAGPDQPEEWRAAAVELDELGYGALWLGNAGGDLGLVEDLLAATRRIVVATGIVNIWAYPATDVAASFHRVARQYPDRVLLGLGASHAPAVERLGREYHRPLAELGRYLDGLDAAPDPVPVEGRVLAALGPKALELAARRGAGAHPYLTNPAHTELARRALGAGPLLAPEQKVVMEPDRAGAREIARRHLSYYLMLPNYVQNLRRLGFTDDDLSGGGSDRLIDALYAHGVDGPDGIVARVREHRDAGADHVCVQVITPEVDPVTRTGRLAREHWRELAASLL